MKTGILVAVAVLALAGLAVAATAVLAAPHPTVASAQGGMGGGMMNGGNGMMGGQYGGMMGGGTCAYQGSYQSCQQYMYDNNYTHDGCPMMG